MSSQQDHETARKKEIMLEFENLFASIAHNAKQRLQNHLNEYQLGSGQIIVLMMLHNQQVCKASDIAQHLGVTSGAVTGITDKLVHVGLVHRVRSEEDRRVVQFSLTEKGQHVLKKIREERTQLLLSRFSDLELEDMEQMLGAFRKFNSLLINNKE